MHKNNFPMMLVKKQTLLFFGALAAAALAPHAAGAQSANTNWVDWDIPTNFEFPDTEGYGNYTLGVGGLGITGFATIPGTSTVVTVTHTGEVHQESNNNSTQWIVSYPPLPGACCSTDPANNSWYTQSPDISPNSPSGSDMLVQTGFTQTAAADLHKLSFSAPVSNVLMAFYSFGGETTGGSFSITFSQPFKIISRTGQVTFGGTLQDSFYADGAGGLEGKTLTGLEGSGVIQFTGVFTDISWEVLTAEYWTGFTLGFSVVTTVGPSLVATQQSLENTATELEYVVGQQAESVIEGLSYTCDRFGKHGICVSIGGRFTSADGEADRASGVAIVAAKLNNNLRIGGWLDAGSYTEDPQGIEVRDSQPMFGFYGVLNADASGAGWEFKVAGAYANNEMTVTRGVIDDSEAGRGTSDLESYGISGTISYNLPVSQVWLLSPYVGLRYTRTAADGYTEETMADVTMPLSFSSVNSKATTLLIGMKATGTIAPNAGLFGHIGFETDLERSSSDYRAIGVDGLTAVSFNPEHDEQRLSAGLGAYLDLSATERLTVSGNYRGDPAQNDHYAATGMVFYTAGF